MDIQEYKNCLSNYVSGLVVALGLNYEAKVFGITLSSFISLSLKPALISFAIANNANRLKYFLENEIITINILHSNQKIISEYYAGILQNEILSEINPNSWIKFEKGIPIIEGSLSHLVCSKKEVIETGDHKLFIFKVISAENTNPENNSGLLYGMRGYGIFS